MRRLRLLFRGAIPSAYVLDELFRDFHTAPLGVVANAFHLERPTVPFETIKLYDGALYMNGK
jgi:hypothetical protein